MSKKYYFFILFVGTFLIMVFSWREAHDQLLTKKSVDIVPDSIHRKILNVDDTVLLDQDREILLKHQCDHSMSNTPGQKCLNYYTQKYSLPEMTLKTLFVACRGDMLARYIKKILYYVNSSKIVEFNEESEVCYKYFSKSKEEILEYYKAYNEEINSYKLKSNIVIIGKSQKLFKSLTSIKLEGVKTILLKILINISNISIDRKVIEGFSSGMLNLDKEPLYLFERESSYSEFQKDFEEIKSSDQFDIYKSLILKLNQK